MNGDIQLILDKIEDVGKAHNKDYIQLEKRTALLFKKYDENVEKIQKVDKSVGILGIRVSINHAVLFMFVAGMVSSALWIWRTK